jgi:hypothetical protein
VSAASIPIETIPNWAPLEARLAASLCAEFMWMYRDRGVEHYKHTVTRLYLLLDASGKCMGRTAAEFYEVPFEEEWKRVSGRAGEQQQ